MTARDTMLRQHFGHPEAFECDESTSQLSARSAYRNQSSASSLADAQQVTKEVNGKGWHASVVRGERTEACAHVLGRGKGG